MSIASAAVRTSNVTINNVLPGMFDTDRLRGVAAGLRWNVGVFRADNRDDILFVADNQAGFGYFKNFGMTRRQGLEAGLSLRVAAGLNLGPAALSSDLGPRPSPPTSGREGRWGCPPSFAGFFAPNNASSRELS